MKKLLTLVLLVSLMSLASAEPDLYIVEAYVAPDPLIAGQGFEVHYTVGNKGNVTVEEEFVVEVFVGDEGFDLTIDDEIPPGKEVEMVDRGWSAFMTPGVYEIVLDADVYDNISESDEDNNLYESIIGVQAEPAEQFPYWIIIVAIIIAIPIAFFLFRKHPKVKEPKDIGTEIKRLEQEKREIEKIIKLAKVKYFKRKIDEESYRQIVKENQHKLMHIEARMDDLEHRVEKIEEELE